MQIWAPLQSAHLFFWAYFDLKIRKRLEVQLEFAQNSASYLIWCMYATTCYV